MDEQRVEAYVNLIQQLLGCESGTEGTILQQHADLVDAGLLVMMEQFADWMEIQGNASAEYARQFVTHLAQILGKAEPKQIEVQDAVSFATEVIHLIVQTRGDRNQVYRFLRANLTRLNYELLTALPIVFKDLVFNNQQPF
jgi:hypothetical protein